MMRIEDAIDFLDCFCGADDYKKAWETVRDYMVSLENDCAKMITLLYEKEHGQGVDKNYGSN